MGEFDKYLLNRFKSINNYKLTHDERKQLAIGQNAEFIFRKIVSSKFRQNNLTDESRKVLREKIDRAVKAKEPIYFIFGFGGYKNHWVEEHHPNAGWAELFNLIYMAELLAPIAKVYEPGVFYEYEAESMAIVVGDNYTMQDVDAYEESFLALIAFLEKYIPNNLKFGYLRLINQYETNSFFYKVGKMVPEKVKELKKLPKDELDHMVKRALFNLKLDGREDLTSLSEDELYERGIEGLAFNHIFLDEDFVIREEYFEGGNHIPLVGSYVTEEEDPANWLKVNSCKRSNISFWTGKGVVREVGGELSEDIVSVGQYEANNDQVRIENSDLLKDIVTNLNKIELIG